MLSIVSLAQAMGHRSQDRFLVVVFDSPVSTENPNDWFVRITFSQPFSIGRCILYSEQWFAFFHLVMPVTSPGRQKTNVKPQRLGFGNDIIHLIPVIVVWPVCNGGFGRIKID